MVIIHDNVRNHEMMYPVLAMFVISFGMDRRFVESVDLMIALIYMSE